MATLTYEGVEIEVQTVEKFSGEAIYASDGVTPLGTRHTIIVVSPPGPDAPVIVGPAGPEVGQ